MIYRVLKMVGLALVALGLSVESREALVGSAGECAARDFNEMSFSLFVIAIACIFVIAFCATIAISIYSTRASRYHDYLTRKR